MIDEQTYAASLTFLKEEELAYQSIALPGGIVTPDNDRGNLKERMMLMVNYARANCVEKGDGSEILDPVRDALIHARYSNDSARAFSLTTH